MLSGDSKAPLTPPSSPSRPINPPMYSTSSMCDFVHTDESPDVQHALHRPRTGRKTWKSLKEKKEAVWPEYLEEALLEALARYRPTSSKDPRALRRFPKRNAYISKYIKEHTNVKRTPKQVGSRLQQLRETCTEPSVIRLICSRDFDAPDRVAAARSALPNESHASRTPPDLRINTSMPDCSPTSSETTSGITPALSMKSLTLTDLVTPYSEVFDQQSIRSSPPAGGSWPRASVHVNLVVSPNAYSPAHCSSLDSTTAFILDLDESGLTDSPVSNDPGAWEWQRHMSVATSLPVSLHTPSVTLSSSVLSPNIHYESVFRLQKDHRVIFEECTQLERISDSHCRPSLFRSSLLPSHWRTVANNTPDLHRYMIIQDIYESAAATDRSIDPIYTVAYNFDCTIPPSPVEQDFTNASPSYSSSPPPSYRSSPEEIRIPLAPIMHNTVSASDMLPYYAGYYSLLPPINGGGELQGTTNWYTPGAYLPLGHVYSPSSYSTLVQQPGMDTDQLAYPNLYPF